ncbi:MAG TPA: hypothetical protein VIX37_06585 [Candidatus Sulfotelmatobacter sp.]
MAIYNAAGKVVFRTIGFGVVFDDDHTGMDLDGDGQGEVVFQADQAGGAHCCWVYNVVTLFPKPHKLFHVGDGTSVDFEKDKEGRVTIWDRVGGTYEYTQARPGLTRNGRFASSQAGWWMLPQNSVASCSARRIPTTIFGTAC